MHAETTGSRVTTRTPISTSDSNTNPLAASENARRMIRITFEAIDPQTGEVTRKAISEFPDKFAPAFRSAIDEIRGEIGGRLEGMFPFKTEQALTDASVALGATAAGINQLTPADSGYEPQVPTSVDAARAHRDAAVAFGTVGPAIAAVIPNGDPNYR